MKLSDVKEKFDAHFNEVPLNEFIEILESLGYEFEEIENEQDFYEIDLSCTLDAEVSKGYVTVPDVNFDNDQFASALLETFDHYSSHYNEEDLDNSTWNMAA